MATIDITNNPLARFVLGAIFVLSGIFVLFAGCWNLFLGFKSKNWPKGTAKILSSEVERHRGSKGGTMYGAEVHYEYSVNGVTYHNNKISFGDYQSNSPVRAKRLENKYQEDHEFPVSYDPTNPERSVLEPGPQFMQLLIVLIGALFFGVGMFLLWFS